jgi:hypothetical protein
MKTKTRVKAGGVSIQHNQGKSLKIKTRVKAGMYCED